MLKKRNKSIKCVLGCLTFSHENIFGWDANGKVIIFREFHLELVDNRQRLSCDSGWNEPTGISLYTIQHGFPVQFPINGKQ